MSRIDRFLDKWRRTVCVWFGHNLDVRRLSQYEVASPRAEAVDTDFVKCTCVRCGETYTKYLPLSLTLPPFTQLTEPGDDKQLAELESTWRKLLKRLRLDEEKS